MQKIVEPVRMATLFQGEIAVPDRRLMGTLIVVVSVVLSLLLKMKFIGLIVPILAAMPASRVLLVS